MRSLGDGLLDRMCNAGIMRRPGIDRNAVKEISTFKKLVPFSVSILLFSFLFRAIMCDAHRISSATPHIFRFPRLFPFFPPFFDDFACTSASPSATPCSNRPSATSAAPARVTLGNARDDAHQIAGMHSLIFPVYLWFSLECHGVPRLLARWIDNSPRIQVPVTPHSARIFWFSFGIILSSHACCFLFRYTSFASPCRRFT